MDAILAVLPGLAPPPGQAPNFKHPWSIRNALYGFVGSAMFFMTLTLGARIYARFFIARSPGADDYLMILGWAMTMAFTGIGIQAGIDGAGVHQWDVSILNLEKFAYMAMIGQSIYCIAYPIIKVSICLQILRIFVKTRGIEFWTIWGFVAVHIMYYTAAFFITVFQCHPVQKVWNVFLPGSCLTWYSAWIVTGGVFNMVTDICLFVFPQVLTMKLHLPTRRKIAIAAVFFVGSMGVLSSILRLVFSIRHMKSADQSFVYTQLALCTYAELTAGVLAGNCVALPGFFTSVGSRLSSLRQSIGSSQSKERISVGSQSSDGLVRERVSESSIIKTGEPKVEPAYHV